MEESAQWTLNVILKYVKMESAKDFPLVPLVLISGIVILGFIVNYQQSSQTRLSARNMRKMVSHAILTMIAKQDHFAGIPLLLTLLLLNPLACPCTKPQPELFLDGNLCQVKMK